MSHLNRRLCIGLAPIFRHYCTIKRGRTQIWVAGKCQTIPRGCVGRNFVARIRHKLRKNTLFHIATKHKSVHDSSLRLLTPVQYTPCVSVYQGQYHFLVGLGELTLKKSHSSRRRSGAPSCRRSAASAPTSPGAMPSRHHVAVPQRRTSVPPRRLATVPSYRRIAVQPCCRAPALS